jgi:hypothetical protein
MGKRKFGSYCRANLFLLSRLLDGGMGRLRGRKTSGTATRSVWPGISGPALLMLMGVVSSWRRERVRRHVDGEARQPAGAG